MAPIERNRVIAGEARKPKLHTHGIKQPRVEGMTPQAVRTKILNKKLKNATRLQPAFPAAVQDDGPNALSPLR